METVDEPGGIDGGSKCLMAQWMAQGPWWKNKRKKCWNFFLVPMSVHKKCQPRFSEDFKSNWHIA